MDTGPCDHSPEGKDAFRGSLHYAHSTVIWHSLSWTFCHISCYIPAQEMFIYKC